MFLSELKAAPYNPRTIAAQAFAGLQESLEQFGDLSGITWNKRTGNLVAGHQRVKALREKYGDLEFQNGELVTPTGTFSVRVVDWTIEKERAANIAANSPTIAGEFTAELSGLLAQVKTDLPNVFDALRLGEIAYPNFTPVEGIEFGDAPEEVSGNIDSINKIKADRKKGNESILSERDSERYIVIVCSSREEREKIIVALGLPSDERYLSAASVSIIPKRRLASSGETVAKKKHAGTTG